jgi:hypothetical protein
MQEDEDCTGATTPALLARDVTTEEAKQLGSADVVKRHSKTNLTHHPTPCTTHLLHRGIWQPYPKWVPRLSWGLPKLRV